MDRINEIKQRWEERYYDGRWNSNHLDEDFEYLLSSLLLVNENDGKDFVAALWEIQDLRWRLNATQDSLSEYMRCYAEMSKQAPYDSPQAKYLVALQQLDDLKESNNSLAEMIQSLQKSNESSLKKG